MTADPLVRQIQAVTFTDSEIKRIMANAANEIGSMTTEAGVRAAQKQMANLSVQAWGAVGGATKIGIGDAVYGALNYQAFFDESLFKAAGMSSQYWRQSMIATSQTGIQNLISRKQNGITLSDRVWQNSKITSQALNDTINTGLALGKSPAEIAASVKGYLRPDVPGGASYAATRLGRSEVLNAYHTTSVERYKETPWVERVKWNTSGSHGAPDECDTYAEQGMHQGWEPGEYYPHEVPEKPHPNCLCYVTPVTMDLDKYAKAFKDGKYDDYIEKQMGCYRHG